MAGASEDGRDGTGRIDRSIDRKKNFVAARRETCSSLSVTTVPPPRSIERRGGGGRATRDARAGPPRASIAPLARRSDAMPSRPSTARRPRRAPRRARRARRASRVARPSIQPYPNEAKRDAGASNLSGVKKCRDATRRRARRDGTRRTEVSDLREHLLRGGVRSVVLHDDENLRRRGERARRSGAEDASFLER